MTLLMGSRMKHDQRTHSQKQEMMSSKGSSALGISVYLSVIHLPCIPFSHYGQVSMYAV